MEPLKTPARLRSKSELEQEYYAAEAQLTVGTALTRTGSSFPVLDRFNSYLRLARVVAWIRQWRHCLSISDSDIYVEIPTPSRTILVTVLSDTELEPGLWLVGTNGGYSQNAVA